jgi:hypothetical protein
MGIDTIALVTRIGSRADGQDEALRQEMLLRARWLHALREEERDALAEASLREVEARFRSWLDAEGPLGDDAPG